MTALEANIADQNNIIAEAHEFGWTEHLEEKLLKLGRKEEALDSSLSPKK